MKFINVLHSRSNRLSAHSLPYCRLINQRHTCTTLSYAYKHQVTSLYATHSNTNKLHTCHSFITALSLQTPCKRVIHTSTYNQLKQTQYSNAENVQPTHTITATANPTVETIKTNTENKNNDNNQHTHQSTHYTYLPNNKYLRYVIYFTATATIIYIVPPLNWCFTTVLRFCRTLYTMAAIAVDYKYYFFTHKDDTAPDYNTGLNDVHRRSATRVLNLCMLNKGLYIKTGQYMASMNHVLPPEYLNTLKVLQDQAPSVSFDVVTNVICNELNINSLSDKFKYFQRVPLAAASLAQVHYAITHDNREVAIKIQYPQLRTDFVVDMFANYLVLTAGGYLFYNFPMQWLHTELRDNLVKELDFNVEGRNADRCRQQLLYGNVKNVRVPIVHWDMASTRVLALEYIHGCKINDVHTHQQLGIDTTKAVGLSIQALSEQIFMHGFVHCDPHPGNIFVRPLIGYKHPIATQAQIELNAAHKSDTLPGTELRGSSIAADNSQTSIQYNTTLTQQILHSTPFEIILLDHGLYREISEHVRLTYCKLFEALILHDDNRVIKYCAELGVKNNWQWFATGVLMRPYNLPIRAKKIGRVSKEEIQRIREKAQKQIPAILQMSKDMPRELLLVMRNQNYLRSLNAEMGAPVNRFRIMARAAVRGIYYQRPTTTPSEYVQPVTTRKPRRYSKYSIAALYHKVKFELFLAIYDIINSLGVWYLKVFQPEIMEQANLPQDDPNALPITG